MRWLAELAAVSVVVPVPFCTMLPAPVMVFGTLMASLRQKARVALFWMDPLPTVPVVPPFPTCMLPLYIVTKPAKVLLPAKMSAPPPSLDSHALGLPDRTPDKTIS